MKNYSEFKKKVNRFINRIRPRYSELTTYQAALIVILLAIFHPYVISSLLEFMELDQAFAIHPRIPTPIISFLFLLILVLGFVLSLVHVFFKVEKSKFEKFFMGVFAIIISGLAGLFATLDLTLTLTRWSWLLLFPLWNYFWGILLLDQLSVPHEAMLDDDASFLDAVIATVSILFAFFITHFLLGYSWAVIVSICLTFANLISIIVGNIIGHFEKQT